MRDTTTLPLYLGGIYYLSAMDIETLRDHYLSYDGVTEETPFGPQALVYKVMGKMWAILSLDRSPLQTALKCDPDYALELRDRYSGIVEGWHLNKTHWNTIYIEDDVEDETIMELAAHSYLLVVDKLSKKLKTELLLLQDKET